MCDEGGDERLLVDAGLPFVAGLFVDGVVAEIAGNYFYGDFVFAFAVRIIFRLTSGVVIVTHQFAQFHLREGPLSDCLHEPVVPDLVVPEHRLDAHEPVSVVLVLWVGKDGLDAECASLVEAGVLPARKILLLKILVLC